MSHEFTVIFCSSQWQIMKSNATAQLRCPAEFTARIRCAKGLCFLRPKMLPGGIPKSSKVRYAGWQFGQSTGEQTGALEAFFDNVFCLCLTKGDCFPQWIHKSVVWLYLTVVPLCFIASLLVPLMIFGCFFVGRKASASYEATQRSHEAAKPLVRPSPVDGNVTN